MEELSIASNSTVPLVERRCTLRVEISFPAVVRGEDASGEAFTSRTVLENLSACGLYLRLARQVSPGSSLLVLVRLSLNTNDAPAPSVALRGTVTRGDIVSDSTWGVALEFRQHRFFYAPKATALPDMYQA